MIRTSMKRPQSIGVLSLQLETLGIIDQYSSLTIKPSFFGVGSYEISFPATKQVRELIEPYAVLTFGRDAGGVAGIVEGIEKSLTKEGVKYRVFGNLLDGIAKWRQVVPSDDPELYGWDVASGTAGTIMAHYVNDHIIAPSYGRSIPGIRMMDNIGLIGPETVAKGRFEFVSDKLYEVAQYTNVGWQFAITDDRIEFQAMAAVDRTGNSDNPLILSPKFQNISSATETIDYTEYSNTVYALGDGEYQDRLQQVYYSGDQTISGWARRETVVDCGNEDDLSRLKEVALQKITELEKVNSLTLEVNRGKVDTTVGEIVTVRVDEIDVLYSLMITDMTISWSASNVQVSLTLGRPPKTLTGQLQREQRLKNIT